jgi:tRNA(Arg) A34 adenosine deaminase TadA
MQFRKRDLKYFNRALGLAHTSTYGVKNIKIGATVVDKRGNTYDGCNSKKSNPLQYHHNKRRFDMHIHDGITHTLHAEMAAIKLAINKRIDLTGASLYVARVGGKESSYGMCRPGAAVAVGITDIFYTTECGYAHERIQ